MMYPRCIVVLLVYYNIVLLKNKKSNDKDPIYINYYCILYIFYDDTFRNNG